MKRWYVVNSRSREESKAALNLGYQDFEVYLPRYCKIRRHARRRDVVLAPLFPNYLFVLMDVEREGWRSINNTIGVHKLICGGEVPLPVPKGVIEDIKMRENDEGVVVLEPKALTKGDVLRINEGAFAGRVGLFENLTGHNRVIVLLDLLGRKVRVKANVEMLAVGG